MINFQSLTTRLLYATARLQCRIADGTQSVGTAFFFEFALDTQRSVPVLVTNKHVVEGSTEGEFALHEGVVNGNLQPHPNNSALSVTLDQFASRWTGHPDPSVDLCAMPFEPLRQTLAQRGRLPFCVPLPESIIPAVDILENLFAMEDVAMIGYPIGLWDSTNNMPIIRRGITASHPAVDFCGKPIGVIDMACFPGSSGSPILIANEGGFGTMQGFTAGSRVHLLGILHAGPQYRADGTIDIVAVPTGVSATASTNIPIHLGYYVKSRELFELKRCLFSQLGVASTLQDDFAAYEGGAIRSEG